jgi:hypothetical protein
MDGSMDREENKRVEGGREGRGSVKIRKMGGDKLLCHESPERLFISVGLVKSDVWGILLDTTLIDMMWDKQTP